MKKFSKGDKVIIKNTGDIWENKTGKVVEESSDEIITKDDRDLTEVTVQVDLNDKSVIQIFNRENLELYTMNEQILKENLQMDNEVSVVDEFEINKADDDYIHDYLYYVDIDDKEYPTWYFAGKIAAAEGLTEDDVVSKALECKYKVYNIKSDTAEKYIILAPKAKLDEVYEDYINYIPGKVTVFEVA